MLVGLCVQMFRNILAGIANQRIRAQHQTEAHFLGMYFCADLLGGDIILRINTHSTKVSNPFFSTDAVFISNFSFLLLLLQLSFSEILCYLLHSNNRKAIKPHKVT
jgi:hypothetical protein